MGTEIERKFLLDGLPDGLTDAGEPISQGYLNTGQGEAEVRLRRAGARLLLTVKQGAGEVRDELEVAIEVELFERLWPLTEGRRVSKLRRRAHLDGGLEAEIDEYRGALAGLRVVEVEFGGEEESAGFRPPSWFGAEVTADERYANRALAEAGAPPEPPPEAVSRDFHLKRDEELGEGLRRVAAGRAERLLERLDGVEEEGLPEAIHGARKDIKKIRSTLRLCREQLGEKLFKRENHRFRDAGRQLSGSRDAEVKLATLSGLEERFGDQLPGGAAGDWRALLRRERDEASDDETGELGKRIDAVLASVRTAREVIDRWPLEGDSWEVLAPGLRRAYRDGRGTMKAIRAEPGDPELVHAWRKRVKDLWYQVRLVEKAWPALLGETVDQIHALTDLLGDHHDLTVLAEDLAGRGGIGGREELRTAIERRQEELLGEALDLGALVYAEKPKAFVSRIGAYWSVWR